MSEEKKVLNDEELENAGGGVTLDTKQTRAYRLAEVSNAALFSIDPAANPAIAFEIPIEIEVAEANQ